MDDTIDLMRSRNSELKTNLRNLVNSSRDDNTEMNLIKSFINEDKENYPNSKMKYFNNLKEQVNDIKNTEYDLPSRANRTYSIRPKEAYTQEPEILLHQQGYPSYKQDTNEIRNQVESEVKGTPIRRKFKHSECKDIEEDISDPLSDIAAPSPKSNLLLKKVLHQNEIIEELRHQLNETRNKNSKLMDKNHELSTLNVSITESKQNQIEQLNQELNKIKLNYIEHTTVDSLQNKIKKYESEVNHLKSKVDNQQNEIETLNNALRDITIKLLVYKNKLNSNENINYDLRESYNNLKFLVNKDLVQYGNQFEILKNLVEGRLQESDVPYNLEQDNTTDILINDGITNQLISSDHSRRKGGLNINKLVARRENEHSPKKLKSYILATLFIIRTQQKLCIKKKNNSKIHNLTDNI